MVAEYNAYLETECGGRSETAKLKQRLTKLNADLENLTDCLIQTKSPTLFEKLEKLEQQKTEFELMLFEREKIYTVSQVTEEELQEVFRIIRSKIEDGSLQALKQLIEVYVNRIDVTDEQITVRFNFFPKVSVPFAIGGGTSPPLCHATNKSRRVCF
jgi:DNA-binding PadR family transcriptional regulator